jgi:ABC-2 type transport system ATP-binding protein
LIEVNNLIKKFGDFRALDGVNMHVASGNIYGLVGPNGAGKSTLIRHLTGVYRQDAGEIFIDGAPVYENKQVKAQMAYIPDEPFYFLQADTLEMMRYFRGMYESFDEKMFYRLQEFFPGIDMKRNIRRLSKGMQKQVAFWLALCCRPKLLILDEPLDGLDPVMRKQIWTILMSEVAERRTTVLVSSHNLRELEDVCDHVGIMNHGKVIIERSLFDLHGNISKIQVACQTGMPKLPKEFEVLHMSNSGRVYTMIVKEYWKPFIHDSFYNHGKSISDDMIERICNAMQCHSWYMQQFCFLIWTRTATEVTEEIYQSQLTKLLDTNADMFITDIDGMPASQIAFLRAVCMGEIHFNAQQVVAEYGLGAPRTITKNKKTLVERDFIEKSGDGFKMVDPVFELWFKREYCNILPQ